MRILYTAITPDTIGISITHDTELEMVQLLALGAGLNVPISNNSIQLNLVVTPINFQTLYARFGNGNIAIFPATFAAAQLVAQNEALQELQLITPPAQWNTLEAQQALLHQAIHTVPMGQAIVPQEESDNESDNEQEVDSAANNIRNMGM